MRYPAGGTCTALRKTHGPFVASNEDHPIVRLMATIPVPTVLLPVAVKAASLGINKNLYL